MISNGFAIISLSPDDMNHREQPGFKINRLKALPISFFFAMLFADSLA
jgi:hypothetical protein